MNKNVVLVFPKPPFPIRDGGQKALAASVELWAGLGVQLTIVVFHTPKHTWQPDQIPEEYTSQIRWIPVFVDTAFHPKHLWHALQKGMGMRAARFFDPNILHQLIEICTPDQTDLVVFESPFTALYGLYFPSRRPVYWYRAHNVEYQIWSRGGKSLKSWIMWLDNFFLKRLEHRIWKKMDMTLTMTHEDRETIRTFGAGSTVEVLPVHMKKTGRPLHPFRRPLLFFHLGAMDWLPTREGIGWFVTEVWPRIKMTFPGSVLHLGGRHFPAHTGWEKQDGVSIHGEVEDVDAFLDQADVLVVPLFQGGGIRIKILEALAAGKAVIASSKAQDGLDPQVKAVCISAEDKAEDWIKAIHQLEGASLEPLDFQKAVFSSYGLEECRKRLQDWMHHLNHKK